MRELNSKQRKEGEGEKHTHAHTHAHARTHARTHTHTHTEREREAQDAMSDHGYARAHEERKQQQQQHRRESQRQQRQRPSTLEPTAGRQQNYSTANKLRGMREERASRESGYVKATEERMGRERQLRLETQRRRRMQKQRRLMKQRKDREKREKQLKARQKKKGAYVNYIRKHLTKIIVPPEQKRKRRREKRISDSQPPSPPPSSFAPPSSSTVSKRKGALSKASSTNTTSSRRTWTKPRVPQAQRIQTKVNLPPKDTLRGNGRPTRDAAGPKEKDAGRAAPQQTSNLLRDLREQMRRNEKLRCSIEALDLQVQLRKQPCNNSGSNSSNKHEVTAKSASNGSNASAALRTKDVSATESLGKEQRCHEIDSTRCSIPGKIHRVKSKEDAGVPIPADSYEAEGIPEVLPSDDHFGYSSSEDESFGVKHSSNTQRGSGEEQAVVVQETIVECDAVRSPLQSPSQLSVFRDQPSGSSSVERGNPPKAPPLSPSSFSQDTVEEVEAQIIKEAPTWVRTLDPAPTKIFDSLDLSMTTRQSIEVERNRQREKERQEVGVNEDTIEEDISGQDWQDYRSEIDSPTDSPKSASPRSPDIDKVKPSPKSTPIESNGHRNRKDNDALFSLKVSSKALTPGTNADMKYNSMRTFAPTSPRPLLGLDEELSQMTVASTSTTATTATNNTTSTQVSEGGYAYLRQKALERKKRNDQEKQRKRMIRKRNMMMSGLTAQGSAKGSTKMAHTSKALDLRKRASWGRDLSNLTPRRRARREAAQRRKEYEKMINIQMKEDRLHRRRALQRQRKRLNEQESRVLAQHQPKQNGSYYAHFYQPQPNLPPAQWQDQPNNQMALLDNTGVASANHTTLIGDAPPSERPLGRDYGCRSNFRAGLDPRSTISIEEDRLRGSLMRLEHRLNQTRKAGRSGGGKTESRRKKSTRYAGTNLENVPSRVNCLENPSSGMEQRGGRQQTFMHTEKGGGANILRYPVAQQQQQYSNHKNNALIQLAENPRYGQSYAAPQRVSNMNNGMHPALKSQPDGHVHQNTILAFQPATEVKMLGPLEGAKVHPPYSVFPTHTTDMSDRRQTGYLGLQEKRQGNHMQRLATMRPVSHQQPRPSSMYSGNQTVRPVSHQQQRLSTLDQRMNRRPKGSLHQKPRTRRVKLGKNLSSSKKVRTSGLVQVDTDKLHLLLSP